MLASIVILAVVLFVVIGCSYIFTTHVQNTNIDVYVINLDKRTDRMKTFDTMYRLTTLPKYKRISAVDAMRINLTNIVSEYALAKLDNTIKTGKRGHHGDLPSTAAIGCYLSHVKVWQECVKNNKPCFVMEDDILLPMNIMSEFEIVHQTFHMSQNTLVLMHYTCNPFIWNDLHCDGIRSDGFQKVHVFFSTAAYYLSPSTARILLDNAFPIEHQVDFQLSTLSLKGIIQVYGKKIVDTIGFDSDIQFASV